MNADITLGRVAGVRIGVNWSLFIVFTLIVWTLVSGVFPSQNPGLSNGTCVAMAIVAAFVFFASLLLHELGHAIQARREGVEIEGITLWLFGGVAQFKGRFRSAGAEFWIAITDLTRALEVGRLRRSVVARNPAQWRCRCAVTLHERASIRPRRRTCQPSKPSMRPFPSVLTT